MTLPSLLRRRWPELVLGLALIVAICCLGVALRMVAVAALGGTCIFAIRRRVRDLFVAAAVLTVLLLAVGVATFTIDIGSAFGGALRQLAVQEGTRYLERPLRIGSLGIRLAAGEFVVGDLRIDGVKPTDAPFFTAKEIRLGFPWYRVLWTSEFLIETLRLRGWTMQIEEFGNGNSMPRKLFGGDDEKPKGPKRFTTTLQDVHAYEGTFTYIDYRTWRTVARNLDIRISHRTGEYLGTALMTNGTVQIKDYLPMRSDMFVRFKVDKVDDETILRLSAIDLYTDGAHSLVTGEVYFSRWPEMLYRVDSRVNLSRMRQLFFSTESWRSFGEARFTGTFRLFQRGGHQLKGDFTSGHARVNIFDFPDLRGSLIWEPHRFEVTDATARFHDGRARFQYSIAPLDDPRPAVARWAVTYRDVDLGTFSDAVGLRGLRLLGRASGRNTLEWPLGSFSQHRGGGEVQVVPPSDVTVLTRDPMPSEAAIHAEPPVAGPEPDLSVFARAMPIGGVFRYRFDPEWFDVEPSHLATSRTYVGFEGRTAYGERSTFPFWARSADWQESDRLLAGIITAFGSPTGVIRVGGHGAFTGTMTRSFSDPRIEGRFTSADMRAWDVVWGNATGDLLIENGYVTVSQGHITSGRSTIVADGLFSIGYPRRDGGQEINARFELHERPLRDLRHAFELDDWPLEGLASGEFRLNGHYRRPYGSGRLLITEAVAWGEPFERASAPIRFEGAGLRIDAAEIHKRTGVITGAAWVGWDGRYSFNADGRRIPMDAVAAVKYGTMPVTGTMHFTMNGAASFLSPRYEGRMTIEDLRLGDEEIGQVMGRLNVKERLLTVEQFEVASPRMAVSGSGRLEMTPMVDAELSLRFSKTAIDPYLRFFQPKTPALTRAVASGTVRAVGQLANFDRLSVGATIEDLDLQLFDYQVRNDGEIRLDLENNVVRATRLRLRDEDTRFAVTGGLDLKSQAIGLAVEGDVNLGVLQVFARNVISSGRVQVRGEVGGTFARPNYLGAARIRDGRIRIQEAPHSIQAINGCVRFGTDGISFGGSDREGGLTGLLGRTPLCDVPTLTGQIAGGQVEFGGRVELSGNSIGQVAVTFEGRDMNFRYPEGFRSTVDAQLDLVGTRTQPILRGRILVKDAVFNRRVDLTPGLLELASGRAASGGGGGGASASLPLQFDLRIDAPQRSLRIENNMAHIQSSANLFLRGTYDHPLLFGRAEVERGEVFFEGRRYSVTRGLIDFTNPTRIEPFFDIEAETRLRTPGQTYLVTIGLNGTTNRMNFPRSSDPPLSDVEIVSLLLGGEPARADTRDAELRALQRETIQGTLATSRLQQAALGVVSGPVTRALEQAFGLDTFQITPNLYDPYQRVTPTARLTVGKRISDKIYFTFSRSLNTPGGGDQLILLEYDQSRRLSWVVSRNEDGTYAIDVRVRHVF